MPHYLMGGIDVVVYGDTTVDRLYAAGECRTGVHCESSGKQFAFRTGVARRCTYDISPECHEQSGITAPSPHAYWQRA